MRIFARFRETPREAATVEVSRSLACVREQRQKLTCNNGTCRGVPFQIHEKFCCLVEYAPSRIRSHDDLLKS